MTTGSWILWARPSWLAVGLVILGLVLPGPVAAQQVVPGTMNFQGLLLDASGEPKNGTVTLVFRLFTAAAGGTQLWEETLSNVLVTDGIYDVVLGATSLLTPAVFSSPTRYLQITVDGEILLPRRQLLVVPYAIRAEAANTAITATNADTATNALNVGGIPAEFVDQVYQYSDFDGNGLLNSDPLEGLADIDGDGLAAFIDPDNDGDDLSDATEVAQGSDPNRLTPTLTGFSPTTLPAWAPDSATVFGTKFDLLANLSVVFGQPPPVTPTNVTATSFEVSVAAQPPGIRMVVVTSSNGSTVIAPFEFVPNPVIAFVTSTLHTGNLGGLTGADGICQGLADTEELVGTYRAWLRSSTDSSRTSNTWGGNNFVRVDGTQFAASYTLLINSGVHSPVFNRTESGATVANGAQVWTGGGSAGAGQNCVDWTSSSSGGQGTFGVVGSGDWENTSSFPCAISARLYCFRDDTP